MASIIEMPKLSDTMTVGTLVSWLKKEGDPVSSGDMIAEIETDKATMELEVFEDGVLLKQIVEAGSQVPIGAPIAAIGQKGEKVEIPDAPAATSENKGEPKKEEPKAETAKPAEEPAKEDETEEETQASVETAEGGRIKASPLARKIASQKGISLEGIAGTGPGGRIVKADVLAAEKAPAGKPAGKAGAPVPIPASGAPIAEDEKISLTTMRSIIAKRVVESKTTIPHFYLEVEIDAAPLMELRAGLNKGLADLPPEKGGIKFSVNDFILKGATEALRRVPILNATWKGDHIQQNGAVHLAVAVAIPDGLVTPKIVNAHAKSLRQISAEVRDLAGRAKAKKLKPDELSGSTFTVSSLGMFGIESFYGIINQPNAAILSVGAVVKKPVVGPNDTIVVGQRMSIGISIDHRVVDGATGAHYLAALKEILETPALMLV